MNTATSGRLSLKKIPFSCKPRMLWQVLFDFYRDVGGRIESMDNMLVDYDQCKRLIDEELGHGRDFTLAFGCDKGSFFTTLVHHRGRSVTELSSVFGHDRWLKVDVTRKEIAWEEL